MASQARVRPSWKKSTRKRIVHQVRRERAKVDRITKKLLVLERVVEPLKGSF